MAYETMLALENTLIEEVPEELASVDGHDCGSGETNIFIHTNDPESVLGGTVTEG